MQGEGALWAPDGEHFAVLSADSNDVFNVYVFNRAGIWVGEAPASRAAWVGNDTLLVLPWDPTAQDGLLAAYVASFGYNDVSSMPALPGRYTDIIGSGEGAAALPTAHGYAVWHDGSLAPEVVCDCGPVAISADGNLVAVEDSAGLKVVSTGSGQDVQSWSGLLTGAHLHASFSPDGRRVALTSVSGSLNTLVVLNLSEGHRVNLLAGHFAYNGAWVDNELLFAGDDLGEWWFVPADGAKPRTAGLPPGSQIAVASAAGAIAAVDGYGTTLAIATAGKIRTLKLPSRALYLYWSPEHTELIVTCELGAVVLATP